MGVLQAITARDLGILLRKILVYTEKMENIILVMVQ